MASNQDTAREDSPIREDAGSPGLGDRARDLGRDFADRATDLGRAAADRASDIGRTAADRACDIGRAAADRASQAHEAAVQSAREHPHKAFALAAGIGAALALVGTALVSRRRG